MATLAAAGFGGIAGCSALGSEDVPAGSLELVNRDTLPHEIAMEITDVGTEYEEDAREVVGDPIVPQPLTERRTTAILQADTTRTYEAIFTEPVWYTVRFTIDGEVVTEPDGKVSFYPGPRNDSSVAGEYLRAGVLENGEKTLVVAGTSNRGPFEQ
ncbi:hypothetical protein [Halorientalis persicus]|uniref:hypothetical protein n=1 Tax=Halorientalis persicus TaxID=1367881 RepID=UPI000B87B499|nr:hypothetical protein [Halorientalis persicus]